LELKDLEWECDAINLPRDWERNVQVKVVCFQLWGSFKYQNDIYTRAVENGDIDLVWGIYVFQEKPLAPVLETGTTSSVSRPHSLTTVADVVSAIHTAITEDSVLEVAPMLQRYLEDLGNSTCHSDGITTIGFDTPDSSAICSDPSSIDGKGEKTPSAEEKYRALAARLNSLGHPD
jgi:hypothetical protein